MSVPLSQTLVTLLGGEEAGKELTLNRLLERTEGRGIYLLFIAFSLPFVVPVSIPGLSPVLGGTSAYLALRTAFGHKAELPGFLGRRVLPPSTTARVLKGSVRVLRWLERWVRPRRTWWLGRTWARMMNLLLIAFLAVLLALPLPSPPFFFTNTLPSYGIIILALSAMEEDGLLVWAGYLLVVGNVVFFGLLADVIAALAVQGWYAVLRFFGHG
jgi:hypothetical protein